ncbi:MAG: hypothetical protein LIP18_03425 [Planctomycetes bacterium]|nr:hypothetical protein [Planctomycetota bacterium]
MKRHYNRAALAAGPLPLTEEEQAFVRALQTNAGSEPVGIVQNHVPPDTQDGVVTDALKFSWWAPSATLWTAVLPGPALHTWVITAAAGSGIGKKAIGYGAGILAHSAVDLIENPEILVKARRNLNGGKTAGHTRLSSRTTSTRRSTRKRRPGRSTESNALMRVTCSVPDHEDMVRDFYLKMTRFLGRDAPSGGMSWSNSKRTLLSSEAGGWLAVK